MTEKMINASDEFELSQHEVSMLLNPESELDICLDLEIQKLVLHIIEKNLKSQVAKDGV